MTAWRRLMTRLKGIFMPAERWPIDGQLRHPQVFDGLGDSWSPTPDKDTRGPWIFGHQFSPIFDVAVAPNGKAAFWANFIESGRNPFLVDLHRPIGWDQVVKAFPRGAPPAGSRWLAMENTSTLLASHST